MGELYPPSDRFLVGSVFIVSCLLGLLSSIRYIHRKRRREKGWVTEDKARTYQGRKRNGHHPDCEMFQDHVITIGDRVYCGGCLGLALGSVAALLCMVVYLPSSGVPPDLGIIFVSFGLLLVVISFIETAIHSHIGVLHVVTNIDLVIGFFLLTIGTTSATGSGMIGSLAVLLSYLFLDTRIQISEWKHTEICRKCGRDCVSY